MINFVWVASVTTVGLHWRTVNGIYHTHTLYYVSVLSFQILSNNWDKFHLQDDSLFELFKLTTLWNLHWESSQFLKCKKVTNMKFNQLDIAVVCLDAKFVPAVANAWQHANPQYISIAHLNSRLPAFKLFLPLKILHKFLFLNVFGDMQSSLPGAFP